MDRYLWYHTRMSAYEVLPALPQAVETDLAQYDRCLKQLLYNRGISTAAAAEIFLNPSYDNCLHDPFLLHDMEKAVTRLAAAMATNEKVVIYSDYDCDGIPGAVVLHDFF